MRNIGEHFSRKQHGNITHSKITSGASIRSMYLQKYHCGRRLVSPLTGIIMRP